MLARSFALLKHHRQLYFDHGCCPRSFHRGTPDQLPDLLNAWFKHGLPSCAGTSYGKHQLMPSAMRFVLIILFKAPQQPKIPAAAQAGSTPDPYYGHKNTACLCARFITHLFVCDEHHPTSSRSGSKLPYFIAHALHQTKLHSSVTFTALVLLQRLKAHFPTAHGSSGRRLFLTAFMIASKVICDAKYFNKSWLTVGQGMFQLHEINRMEREMCQYLDWELNVEPDTLKEFEDMVRKDFAGPGPYPIYDLPTISKPTTSTTNPFTVVPPNGITSPIPAFGPTDTSPPKPIPWPLQIHHQNPQSAYISPPDTPSPCSSDSTSPASSASPPTPTGMVDDSTAISEPNNNSPGLSITKPQEWHMEAAILKQKTFAFVTPTVW